MLDCKSFWDYLKHMARSMQRHERHERIERSDVGEAVLWVLVHGFH